MRKRGTDGQSADGGSKPESNVAGAKGSHEAKFVGALRIADLLALSDRPAVVLDYLRKIDRSARQVIGGNLSAHSLNRDKLEHLRASVIRQASQARELQQRLAQAEASDVLQDELAEFIEFLEESLAETTRQLGPTQ